MQVTARSLLTDLYRECKKDDVMRHAAAIAYYTVFSLPAFILVVLSLASSLLDAESVNREVFGTIRTYMGERTVNVLETTLTNAQSVNGDGSLIGIAGIIVILVASTGVIRELQKAMNKIINAKVKRRTFLQALWTYALSLVLLLVTAAVLIASVVSGTIIGVIGQRVQVLESIPVDVLGFSQNLISYVALTAMVFLLYVVLPQKKFPWLIALLCSIIASSLMVTGTIIASYYIARTGLGKAYGVAANVLVLLFWIYFGANVFLLGTELMEVTSSGVSRSRRDIFNSFRRLLKK